MTKLIYAVAALALTAGAAYAQGSDKPMDSTKHSPGTVGAMGNVNANGVATDPGGVAAQQGSTTKASPGTVGAAPGANVPSQKPNH